MELICETGLHCNLFNVEVMYVINGRIKIIRMKPCSRGWKTDIELPDGEYQYKFILNNGIRMNDPNAYGYNVCLNDEVWSVLKIVNGKIQKGNKIIPKFNKFIINNGKMLLYPRNRACYVSFDLNDVCGVHSITALWYQPDGSLYHIEETTIETPINGNMIMGISGKSKYDFYEVLKSDYEAFLSKVQEENGLTREGVYLWIENWLKDDEDMKNGISDVLGLLSEGKIEGKYGHGPDYYKKNKIEKETFAHFFEAGMSYKPLKQIYIQEIFPNAHKVFEQMVTEELEDELYNIIPEKMIIV